MEKLSFSGHDTFICKQPWLKKGYDFITNGNSFSDESSVIELGVGKNMVSAIKYWLKSFGIIDEKENITEFAKYIFDENGMDPYIEDIGTIWLLHYNLIKTNKASIYNIIFNEFIKERTEYPKENIVKYILRICEDQNFKISEKTLTSDINVFIRNYFNKSLNKNSSYEDMAGVLSELNLVLHSTYKDINDQIVEIITFNKDRKENIPEHVILYSILDYTNNSNSINIRGLVTGDNSLGKTFLINSDYIIEKIDLLKKDYPEIVFSETSGNQVIQFKKSINKWNVLDDYYKN